MNRHRQAAVVAALGAVILLAGAAPAHAAGDDLRVQVSGEDGSLSDSSEGPLFADFALAPGFGVTRSVRVHNDSSYDAELDLSVIDLVESENGCLEPEERHPGEECDADGGELAEWLTMEISSAGTVLWSGPFRDLEEGVLLRDQMDAGETLDLDLDLAMEYEAGNDTMTDRVGFGLRWAARSDLGETEVEQEGSNVDGPGSGSPDPTGTGSEAGGDGAAAASGGVSAAAPVGLPMTGATLPLWVVVLDLLVIAAGCALAVAARRRRAAPVPVTGSNPPPGAHARRA